MVNRLVRMAMSVSLLGVLAACSDSAQEPVLAATPTGLPAGTPLFDTLRTPQGTLLLGRVFPQETGATALMLVTGDPLVAWSDIVDQATQTGFKLTPGFGTEPCWLSTTAEGWWGRPGDIPLSGQQPKEPTGVGCDADGEAPAGADGRRRSIGMRLRVGVASEPYLAHLLVWFAGYDSQVRATVSSSSAHQTQAATSSPVLPKPFTQVPAVGAPLGQPFFDGEGYRVAEGSAMVAPVFPSSCATGGFIAVARVIGSTSDVVDRYAEQFRQAGLRTEDRTRIQAGSTTASKVNLTTAGGGHGTITAVSDADETYLLLERCND